jgi:hypothetical protein
MDQIYETELDGTTKNQFRVGIMPSLGFGIGYQVAPRVTIGLEHKSTFTQIDDFDGFVRESKYKQDIYHYTSGFVQVRFKARDQRPTPTPTSTGTAATSTTSNVTSNSECLSPVINIIQPASSGLNSNNISYAIVASISNVENRQDIVFKVNGVSNLNYTFNPQTDRFESNVVLNQGSNSFELSATNACGNASQSSSIAYSQCQLPVLTRITPSMTESTVNNPAFAVALSAQNVTAASGISVTVNNRSWTGFTYNATNGQINGTVTLQPGQNVFVIKATNACGTVSETFTVNYQQCVAPIISMVVPSGQAPTVTQANYAFSANIQHVTNQQAVKVKFNNQVLSGVSFSTATGNVNGNVTLAPGVNTFEIAASNECGSDVETFTVNYQNCIPPVISMTSPTTSGTTVNSAAFTLSCIITNATAQGISVTHNNRSITNFNYNAGSGTVQSSLVLLPGLNTFVVTSTNGCGTDTETITVNFLDCVAPNITLLNPATSGTTVTTAAYLFKATVFNAGNAQNVVLKQNGNVISGVNFNATTNQVQAFLTLASGTNTIILSASNACGMDAETTVINYNDCVAPVLTVTNPANSGLTVTQSPFTVSGTVSGLTNSQQLQVLQNGQQVNGVTLNGNAYTANVSLVPGTNTFVIKATNSCGVDTKTIIVQYNNCVPPVITVTSPINGSTTTSNSVQITAQIANANSSAPTITVNNRSILLSGYNPANGSLQMNVPLIPGQNTITITVTNACGTDTETITVNYQQEEQKIKICHYPPGNTGNPQTIEIPASAWAAHQAHGDKLGPCPEIAPNSGGSQGSGGINNTGGIGGHTGTLTSDKITICHYPPGNTGNPQTIEIPLAAWPAHEAHGDKLGPCTADSTDGSQNGNSGSGSVNTDGNSNGNSIGTGVGRPGGSGTSNGSGSATGTGGSGSNANTGGSNNGNANGSSGTVTSGSGTGTTNTGGTSNGNSMGTGTGRPGTGSTSGSGTTGSGSGTPAPTANPSTNGSNGSGNGSGATGTGNKGTTKPSGANKPGNLKPGQTEKKEGKNSDGKTESEPGKTEEKVTDPKKDTETPKSGGGQ